MGVEGKRRAAAETWINDLWYPRVEQPPTLAQRVLLLCCTPLEILFGAVVALRRLAYRFSWARAQRIAKPVVVVGNISVGGTGKTPMTIYLARTLVEQAGLRVGIVTRGYASRQAEGGAKPVRVTAQSDPAQVGDEAVVLARETRGPVIAGRDRVAGARMIEQEVDVVLADDGLQHLALVRDLEIVLMDAKRGLGNGRLLPCGPLREPPGRLAQADLLVLTGAQTDTPPLRAAAKTDATGRAMDRLARSGRQWLRATAIPAAAVPLRADVPARPLAAFQGQRVHAVAGIASPERFFNVLRAYGLEVIEHAFADHAVLSAQALAFEDALPVLMTDKDAVKCRPFADDRCWVIRLEVRMSDEARDELVGRIRQLASQGES